MNIDFSEALRSLTGMVNGFIERLPYLAVALLVFLLFSWAAKGVRNIARNLTSRHKRHQNLALVIGRLAQGTIVFLGVLIAMVIALPNFQPGQLVQLLGISSVAIGFAFKDIFQNFLAGILLLLNEPFRIGDQIKVGEFEGTVEDIQTRATFIQTFDGRRIVIPNGDLFNQSVTVTTAYQRRRFEYEFAIDVNDDLEKARQLILGVLKNEPGILEDPAPDVLISDFDANAVSLKARWWVAKAKKAENLTIRANVLAAVKSILDENNIDLPLPAQTFLIQDSGTEGGLNLPNRNNGHGAAENKPLILSRRNTVVTS